MGVCAQGLDEVWKLLSEDVSVREKILRHNRAWFDCDQQTFEQEIKRVAALESFSQRFDAVGKIRQESAAAYYHHSLPQLLRDEPSISWFEMMPPAIAGLLRHFRLPASSQKNILIADRLAQSAETLVKEEGLSEAIERFACLPVRMPELLVAELMRLPREERVERLRSFSRRWASPISSLHLVDLVMRTGDGGEDFLAVARSAVDWLSAEEKGETRLSLFRQTLRLVSIGLGRVGEAKQLDIATKLLLVWAHAARLHNLYGQIGKGVTFPWVDEWSSWESVFEDKIYLNDVLHPQRLSRPVFLTHGLSAIFADRGKELADALGIAKLLVGAAFLKLGEQEVPAIQLLSDPTLVMNQTGSFLGGDRTDSIRALLGEDAASLLSPAGLHQWVKETIENLVGNPFERAEWLKIQLVTDDLPLPSELAEFFREMVEKLDLLSLYKNSPEATTVAIRVIAAQLADARDETLRQRFERDLLQIVLRENGQAGGKEEDEQMALQRRKIGEVILEIAVRTVFRDAAKPGDQRSTDGLLLRLVEYAGQFRDLIPLHGLIRVIHEMPPEKAWRLWPFLLAARAAV